MKKPIRGNEERATQGAGERGSREQASRRAVDVHGTDVHGIKVDRELERRVLGVVHDPEDDAHRQSMGGLIP